MLRERVHHRGTGEGKGRGWKLQLGARDSFASRVFAGEVIDMPLTSNLSSL
jgi:hypothetical protein